MRRWSGNVSGCCSCIYMILTTELCRLCWNPASPREMVASECARSECALEFVRWVWLPRRTLVATQAARGRTAARKLQKPLGLHQTYRSVQLRRGEASGDYACSPVRSMTHVVQLSITNSAITNLQVRVHSAGVPH